MEMNHAYIVFLFNPFWVLRQGLTHANPAYAPTLWTYDANGYVSPSNGRSLSGEETSLMNGYNSERGSINAATQDALDNMMRTWFPLSDSIYSPIPFGELYEIGGNISWLGDHENGTDFYTDPGNYQYYGPDNPDAEADLRLARLQYLLNKAGLQADDDELAGKVMSGVGSPIIIDLYGDGIQTSSLFVDGGVLFDIDGDGIKDKTAWVSGDNAFLAVDKDGNGQIDGVNELFGGLNRGEGFANLATYDSNGDGKVDQFDEKYSELLLWRDVNQNGITDDGELQSASVAGLESISANYASQEVYESGNLLGEVSTAVFQGQAVDAIDVYFRFKQGLEANVSPGEGASNSALISAMAGFFVPSYGESFTALPQNLLNQNLSVIPA